MQLTTAAQTDIGLVRSNNEDRLLCADDLRLYAVADGIGGLPGGAEAAQTAIDALLRAARDQEKRREKTDLADAFLAANQDVVRLGEELAPDTGLGTTLCAIHLEGTRLRVANVGDSRAYLLRDGKLTLLTHDDTVENDVIRRRGQGELVEMQERYRNALTRCIGQPMPLHVKVDEHELRAGDRLLVCSDGISRLLPDSAIATHLGSDHAPAVIIGALVGAALARGGNDNATGVVIQIEKL